MEIKKNINLVINYIKKFNEIKFTSLLSHFFNDSDLKFKNSYVNEFLEKNKKEIKKFKRKEKILVELLVGHHTEVIVLNCLIAKDLSDYFNCNCVAIVNRYDFLTQEIAKSFNINNFIYLDEGNFFLKISYFIKSLFLIDYNLIEKKLFKLKFNKFEIGKSALEHYSRFHNYDPKKKNKFLLYQLLYRSLMISNVAKKIFEKKYKFFILAENQFLPGKMLFHHSLMSKTPVYTWRGNSVFGHVGRIYNDYKDRNSIILQQSKKLTKIQIDVFSKKNTSKILFKKGHVKNIGFEPVWGIQKDKNKLNFNSKEKFYNHFKLERKKNILILPHVMADNLYNNNWNIFHTAYDWFYETIQTIKKIKDVNWIIKPHPYEYNFEGITAEKIMNELNVGQKNIIFLKENIHINKIYSLIDGIITGNGSAGYEYPSLGIPAITTSDAPYSNFNFTISPKNKFEYFEILKKITNIKKPSKLMIKRAQVYWLSINTMPNFYELLPKIKSHAHFKKDLFFSLISKNSIKRSKKKSLTEDIKFQLSNRNRHSININFINKYNLKSKLNLNDI